MSEFGDFVGKVVENVSASRRSPYLEPGVYELECTACVGEKSRAGTFYFVAEFDVVSSDNPKFPPGSKTCYYVGFKDNVEQRSKDLLHFHMGFGLDVEEAKKAMAKGLASGPQQIFAGERVNLVAREAVGKKSGKPYVDYAWSAPVKAA